MSYLCSLTLKTWTSSRRREGSAGMDMWNAPTVQSSQPVSYRLMESLGLGDPRWHESSWQRGIAECRSSLLSTLMTDTPGDLVWDLPCMQQASYLEVAHWSWCCPCTCTLIKNPVKMMNNNNDKWANARQNLQQGLCDSKDSNQPAHLCSLISLCWLYVLTTVSRLSKED